MVIIFRVTPFGNIRTVGVFILITKCSLDFRLTSYLVLSYHTYCRQNAPRDGCRKRPCLPLFPAALLLLRWGSCSARACFAFTAVSRPISLECRADVLSHALAHARNSPSKSSPRHDDLCLYLHRRKQQCWMPYVGYVGVLLMS